MTVQTPFFSILVPAHNVAPYLVRCVRSILDQPGPDREVLLIEDASTDETPALCDRLSQQDSRIRVIHCTHRDVSLTRNEGLDAARGTYIGFADGDDALAPHYFEALEPILRKEQPDLVRFGCTNVWDDGRREEQLLSYPEGPALGDRLRQQQLDAICPAQVLDYSAPRLMAVWAGVFRRDFLGSLRFESQRIVLSEDYLFLLTALFRAKKIYHLKKPLYEYGIHTGSLSHAPKPRMMERKRILMQRYLQVLPEGDGEINCRLRNFYIDSVYDCFVNAALQCASRREALALIRPLLADPELHRCLRESKSRIAGRKQKIICFLMDRQMAEVMLPLYRLMNRHS